MKKLLIAVVLLVIILSACSSSGQKERTVTPAGKLISIEYLSGGLGSSPKTILATETHSIVVFGNITIKLGEELELISDPNGCHGAFVYCARVVGSDRTWVVDY